MTLEEFLKDKGVSETIIEYFTEQKIDCEAIGAMSEEDLRKLLPAYGDRVALKSYAQKNKFSSKQSLIERLQEKMLERRENYHRKKDKSSNAQKQTRIIEIGWLCLNQTENRYRQVRARQGGGTRRVTVDKASKCSEVLEIAKNLFFPGAVSSKGPLSHFEIELMDYKNHNFDQNLTIQEMYEMAGLPTLRFYLATICKLKSVMITEHDFIPATQVSTRRRERLTASSNKDQNKNNSFSTSTTQVSASAYLSSFVQIFENEIDHLTGVQNPDEQFIEPIEESSIFLVETESIANMETLIVHRGNIFEELMNAVKIHNYEDFMSVKIEMTLPNGNPEIGEDVGGVLRDALTEFWETFYEKCSIGTNFKIPYLRHDFQEQEWKSIGKILANGYLAVGYFPIKLSPVFIKDCFDENVEEEEIFTNFQKYICESEAEILHKAINKFEAVDMDDLLEMCSNYGCKWQPTKENIKKLFLQIATEELIQKHAFVKNCFGPELKKISAGIDIEKLYARLEPSVKNIVALIKSKENLWESESEIMKFLKRFIKESDEKTRSYFLRYCTGSDLPTRQISIEFTDLDGIKRVPIAHTCTGLLQLPVTYENYVTFRSEFYSLLSSRIWVMDLV